MCLTNSVVMVCFTPVGFDVKLWTFRALALRWSRLYSLLIIINSLLIIKFTLLIIINPLKKP